MSEIKFRSYYAVLNGKHAAFSCKYRTIAAAENQTRNRLISFTRARARILDATRIHVAALLEHERLDKISSQSMEL